MSTPRAADGKTLTLRTSRLKAAGLCVLAATLAAFGYALRIPGDPLWLWLTVPSLLALLFGLLMVVHPGTLTLDDEGIVVRTILRTSRLPWEECRDFRVQDVRGNRLVVYTREAGDQRSAAGRAWQHVSRERILASTYAGVGPHALAETLNEWRADVRGEEVDG